MGLGFLRVRLIDTKYTGAKIRMKWLANDTEFFVYYQKETFAEYESITVAIPKEDEFLLELYSNNTDYFDSVFVRTARQLLDLD